MNGRLSPELVELIGEEAVVHLAESFGGTRLYVPEQLPAAHEIVRAIGADAARRLAERFAPDVIRVPLARELRARHYRAARMTNAQIAVRLGITETGVNKLFKRVEHRADDQPGLFDR